MPPTILNNIRYKLSLRATEYGVTILRKDHFERPKSAAVFYAILWNVLLGV